jgi:hypothetical protein
MNQPHKKGLANHLGPESCASDRKAAGEALTGGHVGQPLSSEITTPACRPCADRGKATPGTALREPSPDAAESKTLSMRGSSMRENRETPETSSPVGGEERPEKAASPTSGMHVSGESDDSVVPAKRANNASPPAAAESVEGRGSTKGNARAVGRAPDAEPGPRVNRLEGVRQAENVSPSCTQGKSRMQ